jgi:hypothetical protein
MAAMLATTVVGMRVVRQIACPGMPLLVKTANPQLNPRTAPAKIVCFRCRANRLSNSSRLTHSSIVGLKQ